MKMPGRKQIFARCIIPEKISGRPRTAVFFLNINRPAARPYPVIGGCFFNIIRRQSRLKFLA